MSTVALEETFCTTIDRSTFYNANEMKTPIIDTAVTFYKVTDEIGNTINHRRQTCATKVALNIYNAAAVQQSVVLQAVTGNIQHSPPSVVVA